MGKLIKINDEYRIWFAELKQRIRTHQLKANISVNSELIQTYWDLGRDIVTMQAESKWAVDFSMNCITICKTAFQT